MKKLLLSTAVVAILAFSGTAQAVDATGTGNASATVETAAGVIGTGILDTIRRY